MEKKRVVPVWVSVILLILCAISIAGIVYTFIIEKNSGISSFANRTFCLCAVILAIIYCFMGYKKSATRFFAAFSIIVTLVVLLQINHYVASASASQNAAEVGLVEEQDGASVDEKPLHYDDISAYTRFTSSFGISDKGTMAALVFGMLFTLTIAKDLGKKKSYLLVVASIGLSLINEILAIINAITHSVSHATVLEILNASIGIEFSVFILCAIYGVMIYAKYKDKEARGTK